MKNGGALQASVDTRYYAFALAVTKGAKPELRAKILGRLAAAVRNEADERGACRDTNVEAATRVRSWL